MGDSAPPPASVDLVDSFARRRDDDVEIVLREPSEGRDAHELVLRQRDKRVRAPITLQTDTNGSALVATLPRRELNDGVWKLRLRAAAGQRPREVEARLLVQGERPLVLLWGAESISNEAPPRRPQRRVARSLAVETVEQTLRLLSPASGVKALRVLRSKVR